MSLRSPEECLAEADLAFAAGDYYGARLSYIEHIFWMEGKEEASLDTLLRIGYCHGRLGDYTKAWRTLEGLVIENGSDVYKGLANVAIAQICLDGVMFPDDIRRAKNHGDHAAEYIGRAIKYLSLVTDKAAAERTDQRLEL